MQHELEAMLAEGERAIESADDPTQLEAVRIEWLGRSGRIRAMMDRIRDLPLEERKAYGQAMNEAKSRLTALFEERKKILENRRPRPRQDPTLPGQTQPRGRRHPLTQTMERFVNVFERLGFTLADGPEIEDDFHNFEALNIPPDHPARDMADTFRLASGGVIRSQTSTIQIRVMESAPPPIRVIAPGRVYRPDAVDATHHYSFSQIEGLAVEEGVTFADLKGVLGMAAKELFGEETKTRFRPSFFPFTEPSAEFDISCLFCGGQGCRICKQSGWVELGGCGMVDPHVFEAVNRHRGDRAYDPERVSGFAFGFGVERLTMFFYGIDDLRLFTENDLRFLRQF